MAEPHPALREITQEEWSNLTFSLTAYTLGFFRRHYQSSDLISLGVDFGKDSDVILPGGYSAADIAQEIVLRVLESARRWDPDRHGDLLGYMTGQVRSLANHCLKSWAGKVEIGVEDGEEYTAEELIDSLLLPEGKEGRLDLLSPEMIALSKEIQIERKKLLDLVMEVSRGDSDLESFVLAYVDTPNPRRRYLAEKIGKSPDEITNLLKRLRNKVIKATATAQKS